MNSKQYKQNPPYFVENYIQISDSKIVADKFNECFTKSLSSYSIQHLKVLKISSPIKNLHTASAAMIIGVLSIIF